MAWREVVDKSMAQSAEGAIRKWLDGLEIRPANLLDASPVTIRMRSSTARFIKRRKAPLHELWYITCDGEDDAGTLMHWEWTVLTTKEGTGGWSASGVAGASGEGPERGFPWVNLGGNWGVEGFRAGGMVEDAGHGIRTVRLTDSGGRVFEDTVENGAVLFLSGQPAESPMTIELFDSNDRLVASDSWG